MELYEHLTPTSVYTSSKTGTTQGDVPCRLCGKAAATLSHVLSVCSALVKLFEPTKCRVEDTFLRNVLTPKIGGLYSPMVLASNA